MVRKKRKRPEDGMKCPCGANGRLVVACRGCVRKEDGFEDYKKN